MPPNPGPDRTASDEAILKAIHQIYGPAVGTSEIAEEVGVARQTADKHLRDMADRGLVNTRMVGQVRVWWLSDTGEKQVTEMD